MESRSLTVVEPFVDLKFEVDKGASWASMFILSMRSAIFFFSNNCSFFFFFYGDLLVLLSKGQAPP